MAALDVHDLVAGYAGSEILRGASIHVGEGAVTVIIGPNGAGKSTLLKACVGLAQVRSGSIRLGNDEVVGLSPQAVIAKGLAYVPQVANTFPSLTVSENLELGAYLHPERITDVKAHVEGLFPVLRERAKERVLHLSGGQRQMVAIGRALMSEPRVLLLDEPTAGLAPRIQDEVLDQVSRIAKTGCAVLLVEQNAKKALQRCDKAYVLEQGRNKFEGTGPELLADDRLGRLYLGRGLPTP